MLEVNIPDYLSKKIALSPDCTADYNLFQSALEKYQVGFYDYPVNCQLNPVLEIYEKFAHKKHFVHIGIGGSGLGPKMLVHALPPQEADCQFTFLENVDPDEVHEKLSTIQHEDALFYIVSKSGNTVETLANLIVICNWLEKRGVSKKQFRNYIVVCTEENSGNLKSFANEYKLLSTEIPLNIGGRYSVLTPVGTLPALFNKTDVHELINGARSVVRDFEKGKLQKDLIHLGRALFTSAQDANIHQTVLMPYSSQLKFFTDWFVQLWSESLGKQNTGLTPLSSIGATDQHSQLQLFMEGPLDKFILFLKVQKPHRDFPLENDYSFSNFKFLNNVSLGQLLRAEFDGTVKAYLQTERHCAQLSIPSLDPYSMGNLIMFFEVLTVFVGCLFDINPFNQPGVESSKKHTKEIWTSAYCDRARV